ncbi:biotin-dependent carboxyltransferase family protein [Nocardioides sp. R1-1]|uniref:5-oxoprolinase subunit C family protein n=1 Tax=Nocardioides sp. R1-1 TaxID=3383502 RepID=UPI0038D24336
MTGRALEVLDPGPLATTQDLGRPGLMSLGVPRSGAADRDSLRLANRLVGNPEGIVAVEATFGGLRVRAHGALTVALTGAAAPARRNDRRVAHNSVVRLADGDVLSLGAPEAGARTYLAVRGGLRTDLALGSGATDLLSGLGPPPLAAGAMLAVGTTPLDLPAIDLAPVPRTGGGTIELPVTWGPRADWLTPRSRADLLATSWTVTSASNRIGLRLAGPALEPAVERELPSEGLLEGAIQVPREGQPILFLADHPVTGGYPVVVVVDALAIPAAGQAVPGQQVRFRLAAQV